MPNAALLKFLDGTGKNGAAPGVGAIDDLAEIVEDGPEELQAASVEPRSKARPKTETKRRTSTDPLVNGTTILALSIYGPTACLIPVLARRARHEAAEHAQHPLSRSLSIDGGNSLIQFAKSGHRRRENGVHFG